MSEPVPTEGEAGVEEPKFGEGCPICEFIEAGDCGELHKDWVKCREDSKKEGGDFVDDCHESFKTFLQCAVEHADYYEPFLDMLNISTKDNNDNGTVEEGSSPAGAETEGVGAAASGGEGGKEGDPK